MAKNILVTGATGQVGRQVYKFLKEKGFHPVAAARDKGRGKEILGGDVDFREFDYNDKSTWKGLFEGIDGLFLAAPPATSQSDKMLIPLSDEAKNAGVNKVVVLAAMGVKSGDDSAFGKIEKHIEEQGWDYTFLHPNWFLQNSVTFLYNSIKEKNGIYLPVGDAKTSFIDTRDIGEVAAEAFASGEHNGKTYTLTGPEAKTYDEFASEIGRLSGKDVEYHPLSEEEFAEIQRKAGAPEDSIKAMNWLYSAVRKGYAAPVSDDVKKVLNREPVSMEQFVKDYADYWK